MKVYICVDMEGHSGIVSWDQVDPNSPRYRDGQQMMVGDVNAAIEGAIEGGATEVIVADLHGMGGPFHIPLDQVHPQALVVSGSGGGGPRLAYLDSTVECMFCVGYHARASTQAAVLDHTMMGDWARVTANGIEIGELGIEAGIAGEIEIPVVLATGDDKLCAEAVDLLGEDVVTYATKFGISRYRALCKPLGVTRPEIRAAARRAMGKVGKVRPLDLGQPVLVQVTHKTPSDVDRLMARQAGVTRVDALTTEQVFDRFADRFGGQWGKT